MDHAKPIILIGDSITEGFDVRTLVDEQNILNYGVSGDSTVECLERLSQLRFEQGAGTVYVCIGTNDLVRDRTNAEILVNIGRIVELIRSCVPNAVIRLTSLFPTRDNPPRPNERIRGFNADLKQCCTELSAEFFDIHRHFADENGDLKKEFTDDGLHLTDAAYRRWAEILNEIMRPSI